MHKPKSTLSEISELTILIIPDTRSLQSYALLCLIFVWVCVLLSGCSTPEQYRQQADRQVYKIIDRKWEKDFGPKCNYKINTVKADPNAIASDYPLPANGSFSLSQAVSFATAYNRTYQTQKEILYIKALELTLVQHQFNPSFFAVLNGGYAREGGKDAAGAVGAQSKVGFNQLLAGGTKITTSIAAAWAEMLSGNLRSGLASIFSATVVQPLWRASKQKIVQENLTQAQRDTLYQIRSFNRFRKSFVVAVVSQYYRTLQRYDAMQNAKNNLSTLSDTYQKMQKLARAGMLPRFELDQAHQDTLNAQNIYIQSCRKYQQAIDDFKITLAIPPTTKITLQPRELKTLQKSKLTTINFTADQAVKTALKLRLDLANKADAVADARRKINVAMDSLNPDLNLIAGMGVTSDTTTSINSLDLIEDKYKVGLQLKLPLDRFTERNNLRKALILLQQRTRQYKQATDEIALQVRKDYRNLKEAATRYQIQNQSLILARKRFKNTFLLLQFARANTRDVLDAQKDLYRAENGTTNALVDYIIAITEFYRDTGVMQLRPDGNFIVTEPGFGVSSNK